MSKKKAPSIRTHPKWDDSNFVDESKLSRKQRQEMLEDPDHEFNYANTYNPNDYEAMVEYYDAPDEELPRDSFDLWQAVGFEPLAHQLEQHEFFCEVAENGTFERNKEATSVQHRRSGKSTGTLPGIITPRALYQEETLHLHIFPTLTQARLAIWNGSGQISSDVTRPAIPYLDLFPHQYCYKRNNHDMTVHFTNGSKYRLGGARGADGTAGHWRGSNPTGVICDEYGDWQDNIISEIFRPVVGQNGGYIFRVGTPKGENQFFRDYMFDLEKSKRDPQHRRAWLLTIKDTCYNDGRPIITEEYVKEEYERGVDPEIIQQEYYCSFKAAASGAWYKHSMQQIDETGRIRKVEYNPAYPIYTDWDLGGSDAFVVGIKQCYGDFHRYIDVIKMESVPIGVVMDAVLQKYPNVKSHFFPHDGKMRIDMVDHFQSRIQALRKKGITNITQVPRTKSLADGIQVTKEYLTQCLFDEDNCQDLVNDLRNYKKKFNKATNSYTDAAVHDKHSHGADMVRTGATAYRMGKYDIDNGMNTFGMNRNRKKLQKRAKFNYGVE